MSKSPQSNIRKITFASFIGSLLEWYDFFLYGTAAALVFNKLFFPTIDPIIGVVASFGTFAVGFIARPIGGIIFGHFGDKIGRKKVLITTLMIMGVGTFLIGVLPTYESIGVWAPIILITLRFAQGLGLGGEYAGAALIVIEHAPRNQRGLWSGFAQSAASAGLLLSTGTFALLALLPDAQFMSWGWRIPFLASIIMLAVGMFIRLSIAETPSFQKVKETKTEARIPFFELLRTYPKNLLLAFGARLGETVSSNIFNAFAIAYVATYLGLSKTIALNGVLLGSAIAVIFMPIFGKLSDRIGRRKVYMMGPAFLIVFSYPFFWLLNTKVTGLIYLAVILGLVFGTMLMFSVQAVYFAEMFGTRVRYSGISVAYQLSSIIGGLTPLIATSLLPASGEPWIIAGILMSIGVISLVSTYLSPETFKKDVSEKEDEDGSGQFNPEIKESI